MKAVKKYSKGGPLTPEEKRRVQYRIKELKGEIGVVRRSNMSDSDKAAEIKNLQSKINELQKKV